MKQSDSKSLDTAFFGHPKGLITLFFTEMWERMSYYGMRMLLVLFMTASLQTGGLDFTVATAAAIYGLYTASVYFMGLPGGWLSDRLLGGQNAVWYGGIIIMCGHIILAIPSTETFFIGMIFVVLGTGLLKPNIAALVGQLYKKGDARVDAGFALYYMGINIGSIIGYTVCGYLQVSMGYHWAFGAAAVGMAAGLIQFQVMKKELGGIGAKPSHPLSNSGARNTWIGVGVFLAALAAVTVLTLNGIISINAPQMAQYVAIAFLTIFLVGYAIVFLLGNLSADEKRKMGALFLVCIASACFWSGFEQAGSSFNLFARDYTDRMISTFEIPAGWFQSVNSFFIILLSPFFAAMWINFGKRWVSPSYGLKCAAGLVIMGSGFFVMYFAAYYAASGLKVAPYWLVTVYFIHTVGELCLSPVALSAVSRLSPTRFAGQMQGLFVMTYSIGNIIAGLLAGNFDPSNVEQMPSLYLQIGVFSVGIGIVIFLLGQKTKIWEIPQDDNGKSESSSSNEDLKLADQKA
jgi:proton-dependent oligopeptide transporter, POT family